MSALFMTILNNPPTRSVYPSGDALATKSVPINDPAPALFSTKADCFKISVSFWATFLPKISVPPPAPIGTINLIGPFG